MRNSFNFIVRKSVDIILLEPLVIEHEEPKVETNSVSGTSGRWQEENRTRLIITGLK